MLAMAMAVAAPGRVTSLRVAMALLAAMWGGAGAEIYRLDKVRVPDPQTLEGLHLFHVGSGLGSDGEDDSMPSVRFVQFEGVAAGSDADASDMQAVQVSLLPYDDFPYRISPDRFCSEGPDVDGSAVVREKQLLVRTPIQKTLAEAQVFEHTVPFTQETTEQGPLRLTKPGAYLLLISNCGALQNAAVQGEVHVTHRHGYLPPGDYQKMRFYGLLTLAYAALTAFWIYALCRFRKALALVHWRILWLATLCLSEALGQWMALFSWNVAGESSQLQSRLWALVFLAKSTYAYVLVLAISSGWGLTVASLESGTKARMQMLAFAYVLSELLRHAVNAFGGGLPVALVLVCLAPAAATNVGIIYWIFESLSSKVDASRKKQQPEQLCIFESLSKALTVAIALASSSTVTEVLAFSGSLSLQHFFQWFLAEGLLELNFPLVLAMLMFHWNPRSSVWRTAAENGSDAEEGEGIAAAASRTTPQFLGSRNDQDDL